VATSYNLCSVTCLRLLTDWINGSGQNVQNACYFSDDKRELKDVLVHYYFRLTITVGITANSEHTVECFTQRLHSSLRISVQKITSFLLKNFGAYRVTGCKMPLQINSLYSHLNFFTRNLSARSEEQEQPFQHDVSTTEERYL
jgi:hypothetical protein